MFKVHLISTSCLSLGAFPFNYCIKKIQIQSLNEFIVYDVQKVIKLQYMDVESPVKVLLPIKWQKNKVVMPKKSGFRIIDDGYHYRVSRQTSFLINHLFK